jgi:hypothetical protein
MSNPAKRYTEGIIRTEVLLVLGILYIALVASTFIFSMNLAADKTMQYVLHIVVILSAIAYLLFADTIYYAEGDQENGRLALIFAAIFTVPILIGRGIGLAVISYGELFATDSIFNFYAAASVSRTIELVSWTTFFPLSMIFLAKLFLKQGNKSRIITLLCLLSAICCFIAFMSVLSANTIYLFIGVAGWGILFEAVIFVYLLRQLNRYKYEQQARA